MDWGATKYPQLRPVYMSGGATEWKLGDDEVWRLVQDPTKKITLQLNPPTSSLAPIPLEFQIYPGTWTLHCVPGKGKISRITVTLAPGSTVTFAPRPQ
jgi:hypothetical protein